jgi:hypothetical protein
MGSAPAVCADAAAHTEEENPAAKATIASPAKLLLIGSILIEVRYAQKKDCISDNKSP